MAAHSKEENLPAAGVKPGPKKIIKIDSNFVPEEPDWEKIRPGQNPGSDDYRAAAYAAWNEVVPHLIREYGIKETDMPLILEYCKAYASVRMDEIMLAFEGENNESNGRYFQNPRVKSLQWNKAHLIKIIAYLGMNITSRAPEGDDSGDGPFDI